MQPIQPPQPIADIAGALTDLLRDLNHDSTSLNETLIAFGLSEGVDVDISLEVLHYTQQESLVI